MEHVNQVGHLSKTPLNLLEIHKIVSVDTSESKQQIAIKYDTCNFYFKSY